MRRVAGYVLVGVGVFLLTLAPMLRFYVSPRLAQLAPDERVTTAARASDATILPPGGRAPVTTDLLATREIRGDRSQAGSAVVVWDVSLRFTDGRGTPVGSRTERVALDRTTSSAVRCCGDSVDGQPAAHAGLAYRFPFGTRQQTYPLYDPTVGRAVAARFAGTATVHGVPVYRFEQRIAATRVGTVDLRGAAEPAGDTVRLDRFHAAERTLWVEPRTGIVVKTREHLRTTGRPADGRDVVTLLDATFTSTPASVRAQADVAAAQRAHFRLLRRGVPVALLLTGLALAALGARLTPRLPGPPGSPLPVPSRSAAGSPVPDRSSVLRRSVAPSGSPAPLRLTMRTR